MASKSVLELAVGTGQWDSGLKKAKQALDNFTQANGGLQSALNKDSQSMQQFVKMMGQMDSTAKTAKGQMNDYKGTIEQLTMQYNRLTDAQKKTIGQDYLRSIDQMKQKYQGVAQEVAKINQELKQTNELSAGTDSGGGGLFGGDKLSGMLQVFGGNVMTKVAGMGVGFVSELGDMVKQGIELARAGEGIRIAFERLNKPGLLDNLREATHGTVTDIELMKAAVKFNDFKLPLEELGTMLAFAQQKAKDTGQSVDYMVDSIVTGLGRKSVMILDNLGLSAAQIKERMKEGGDMTKAVGDIIREEMAKAGDYVETAADRAARATVDAKNKMEELGRAAIPVAEEFDKAWNTIKIGGMKLMNTVLTPLANSLKYIQSVLGSTSTELFEKAWSKAGGEVGSNVDDNGNYIRRPAQKGATGFDWDKGTWKPGHTGAIYNSATGQTELPEISVQGHIPTKTTGGGGGGGGNRQPINISFNADKAALAGEHGVDTMPSVWAMMGGDEGLRKMMGIGKQHTDLGRVLKEYVTDPDKSKRDKISEEKTDAEILQGTQTMISSLQSIVGGINQLGIDIPQELNDIFGVLQTITGIVGSIQAMQQVGTWLGLFSHGGVVHAANGYVDGNTYSGDQIPAMLNAGEVVLNRSQAGVLAASLQAIGQGGNGGGGKPYVSGEMIWLGLTNYLNRSGRGEIVTSKRR